MHCFLRLLLMACVLLSSLGAAEADGRPMVMLKLDDLVRHGKGPEATVSPRWQKVTDFINAEQVKANYGIICESLEGDCPAYAAWLKALVASGRFEIWNHGYYGRFPKEQTSGTRLGEFLGATVAEHSALFVRSLVLVREKTGIVMQAYGPHAAPLVGPDAAAAYTALAGIPEFKLVFFYAPPDGTTTDKVVVPRLMELEKPLFVPNAANVQASFEAKGRKLPLITVQGHPNQWDDERFAEFAKAVRYLKEQGCRFVTVGEYLATLPAKPVP
jgi:peptidoglycan/xylan/chitin deacetylase (PgdA/CDA1 family)